MRKILLCVHLVAVAVSALSINACGADPEMLVDSPAANQDAERWTHMDDPAIFGDHLERAIGRLPLHGRATRSPWVGSYWPMYLDSVNFRWGGPSTASAIGKYERAFGGSGLESIISGTFGIDAAGGGTCYAPGTCGFGRMCAIRAGAAWGRCMPLWYGMCQGWASASVLEPEPRRPVISENGVRFDIPDIKALLTLMYNDPEFNIVSMRCEENASSLARDAAGRPLNSACRDSNPGTFHLLLANYLGLQGRSFVEDRSMDADVWNQPLVGYDVVTMKQASVNDAHMALGVSAYDYNYNPAAARLVYVMTDVQFIRESAPDADGYMQPEAHRYTYQDRYEYILELDSHNRIIGGEWVGPSKQNHPDFLWLPKSAGSKPLVNGWFDRNIIRRLADAAAK